MGYTHYWKMDKPMKGLMPLQKELVLEVLKENKKFLFGPMGTGKPIFTDDMISLNGNAKTDEDHETFEVNFRQSSEFEFCKTARKPYDLAVCKLLCVFSLSEGFNFSSDGTERDSKEQRFLGDESWPEALAWFTAKGYSGTIKNKIIPYLNRKE